MSGAVFMKLPSIQSLAAKPEDEGDTTVVEGTTMHDTTVMELEMFHTAIEEEEAGETGTTNSTAVVAAAARFPRVHMGSVVYTPGKAGLSKIDGAAGRSTVLLPLLPEHVNCTVDVHIPFHQLVRREEVFAERRVWGDVVYTDDSDVMTVLKHAGVFGDYNPYIHGDEYHEKPVREFCGVDGPTAIGYSTRISGTTTNTELEGDVTARLVVLPPLTTYAGRFRHGVNLRTWPAAHAGMSIGLLAVTFHGWDAIGTTNDWRKEMSREVRAMQEGSLRPG